MSSNANKDLILCCWCNVELNFRCLTPFRHLCLTKAIKLLIPTVIFSFRVIWVINLVVNIRKLGRFGPPRESWMRSALTWSSSCMWERGGAFRFRSQHLLFVITQHRCSLSSEVFSSVSLDFDLISEVFVKPFDFFQLSGISQQATSEPQYGVTVGTNPTWKLAGANVR